MGGPFWLPPASLSISHSRPPLLCPGLYAAAIAPCRWQQLTPRSPPASSPPASSPHPFESHSLGPNSSPSRFFGRLLEVSFRKEPHCTSWQFQTPSVSCSQFQLSNCSTSCIRGSSRHRSRGSAGPLSAAGFAALLLTHARKVFATGAVSSSEADGEMAKEPPVAERSSAESVLRKPFPADVRTELFPHIEPHRTGRLRVSDVHDLYWEESGNPNGKAVVFLHGGPGGGTAPANRRFFDPNFYRIILMDQRGSGKSMPHASVEDNTTWDLVADIEKLRTELKIDRWLVFGGSWGTTLSLSYAETHPDRVLGLILRGIFLLRKKEIDWFYQSGADSIYPDAWEAYRDFIPVEERGDFVAAYHKRLMDESNPDVQMAAAKAWTGWEMATSYLIPNEDSVKRGEDDKFALAFAKIENHYFYKKGFFETDGWLLENAHKIRHIPGIIIQGRYDIVCPMMSAWDLHRAWPEAVLKIITNAGHSANEPGITGELVAAMEKFKAL